MQLPVKLNKPLLFFDLETTGVNTLTDRIVEIYCLKVDINYTEHEFHHKLNPGMPIPPGSTAIHGISDEDVKDSPAFKDIAHTLHQFIGNSNIAGFNSNKFDIPLLSEEFHRAGIHFEIGNRKFVDVQRIFHIKEPRNLAAAYKFYCEKNLEDAHSAKADVVATFEVFKAQLDKYADLSRDVDELHRFTGQENKADLAGRIVFDEQGAEIFNFGKHKGKKVDFVFEKEPAYYDWMMNGDFAQNTKDVITKIKLRKFNNR